MGQNGARRLASERGGAEPISIFIIIFEVFFLLLFRCTYINPAKLREPTDQYVSVRMDYTRDEGRGFEWPRAGDKNLQKDQPLLILIAKSPFHEARSKLNLPPRRRRSAAVTPSAVKSCSANRYYSLCLSAKRFSGPVITVNGDSADACTCNGPRVAACVEGSFLIFFFFVAFSNTRATVSSPSLCP